MILYCDTSALLKRFVQEVGSDEVRDLFSQATQVVTSSVAFAEGVAALARRHREGDLSTHAHEEARSAFMADYEGLWRVPVAAAVNQKVSELVLDYPLRGFDALHLASALLVREHAGRAPFFACYDKNMNRAAAAVGLQTLSV